MIPADSFGIRIPEAVENRLAVLAAGNHAIRGEAVVREQRILELLEERTAIDDQIACDREKRNEHST